MLAFQKFVIALKSPPRAFRICPVVQARTQELNAGS